jgi:hypothetical protein
MQINHKKTLCFDSAKVAGLVLLLMATMAQAANWEVFRGRSVAGTTAFWDANSVEIEHDKVVKGWVKLEYSTPRNINGNQVVSRMTHRAVNCATGRYWVMEDWLNVRNGRDPIQLAIGANEQQWQKAAPESEGEMALDALCYATKSFFDEAWDSVKEAYESPKADIADVSTETMNNMEVTPDPQDTQFKAWVGETSVDSAKVEQKGTHVIISRNIIRFIVWDNELQIFKEEPALPMDQINSAALVSGGNYEQLKQIQLITTNGKVVISFSTGEEELAEHVYAALMRDGVKDFSTSRFVHGYRVTKQ